MERKIGISLVFMFVFSLIASLGFASAHTGDDSLNHHSMMGGTYGFTWFFGWIFMILIVVALVLLIIWLLKEIKKPKSRKSK
jgi:uncharacterized membrane protein